MKLNLSAGNIISLVLTLLVFTACSVKELDPVIVKTTDKKVDYTKDIKPILDNRCVVCHSCYNSPCQAKFSSFEGIERGGSKIKVYDGARFRAIDPTRLFVDAQSTKEWREKGFFSLTDSLDTNASSNDSIMIHMLNQKMENPDIVGDYSPETDDLMCPRDKDEVNEYFDDKPNHGMPYGLPSLKQVEYNTLANWLHIGANAPSKSAVTLSEKIKPTITKWEKFFNNKQPKYVVTARYIYEHIFLAHLNFEIAPDEFYEIVRSRTAYPEKIDIIASVRPFDDPKVDKFYYRFRKIDSTIVHKTHMVYKMSDAKLNRYKELFIEAKWEEKPHLVDYEIKSSANPFVKFEQIPPRARYQFMLDDAHYTIMTFIRGPVCRGQIALNVIHDHFWVMFKDPNHDLSILYPEFLIKQANNLEMPIETNNKSIFRAFSDKYREKYKEYFRAKENLYDIIYANGQGIESIWKGNKPEDAPLLSIYRHFDSASVHKGVIGELPRTMWVIDYPQLERIYYSLVAGYDVYGNVSHQSNIRRYMDFLRLEGEANFLAYMPSYTRYDMFKSWYIGDEKAFEKEEDVLNRESKIDYQTKQYKSEFVEKVVNNHILKTIDIKFDEINYYRENEHPPKMPKEFNSIKDIKNGFRNLTEPGTNFLKFVSDRGINTVLLKVEVDGEKDHVGTIVINRWHDNVNSLFGEKNRLDSNKDTLDFISGSVGSYPNLFCIVNYKDLPDFFDLVENFENNEYYFNKVRKYFISRDNRKFWETYDWFQDYFNKSNPTEAGLYDLNRYYRSTF